jgi:DNA-binding transcriptional MerR regulator
VEDRLELPEKLFFKIGEVSQLVGAEPHVLRYWEKEFAAVRPRKSRGGQRLYRRTDVETLFRIKTLLRDEGYTVAGARKKLADERARARRGEEEPSGPDEEAVVEQSQQLLLEVEQLKAECQGLREARAVTQRRLAACEETLRQVKREMLDLLTEVNGRDGFRPG